MSRDITIRKTQVDPACMALPFIYINPQFGYSVENIMRYMHEGPDYNLEQDAFPYDINEYYWAQEGIPGKQAWYALGSLKEGLYFFYNAFTYTTFDKGGSMNLWISHRFSDLIQYAMDTLTYNTYITDTTDNQNKISDGSASDP